MFRKQLFVVVHGDGVRLCFWTAATNGLYSSPDDIWARIAMVEWYWQTTEELGEKPVPVPLCPQQTPETADYT
jgi:hypothetical protein